MEHHAYLIVDEHVRWDAHIARLFAARGITERANLDLRRYTSEQLSVDEARAIKEAAYHTASTPGAQVWHVLCFTTATHEAQNALLKVLEEPPASARFLLCVTHEEVLLPTVRSRLARLAIERSGDAQSHASNERADPSGEVSAFLAAPLPARLEQVERYLNEFETDPLVLHRFLDRLEQCLAREVRRAGSATTHGALLRILFSTREYLYGRSPSRKLLAERLALSVPSRV